MLPFSLVVRGVPISSQTRGRARLRAWVAQINTAAQALTTGAPPSADPVALVVTHYYDAGYPDVDNIIKPIQDALKGVVYADDRQVQHTSSRRRSLEGSYRIRNANADLLTAFSQGTDFVHIQVSLHVDTGDLNA
jgi:crossover junction endodeoxyribonuclease RusA